MANKFTKKPGVELDMAEDSPNAGRRRPWSWGLAKPMNATRHGDLANVPVMPAHPLRSLFSLQRCQHFNFFESVL